MEPLYCLVKDGKVVTGPRIIPKTWPGVNLRKLEPEELKELGWLPTNLIQGCGYDHRTPPVITADSVTYALPNELRENSYLHHCAALDRVVALVVDGDRGGKRNHATIRQLADKAKQDLKAAYEAQDTKALHEVMVNALTAIKTTPPIG